MKNWLFLLLVVLCFGCKDAVEKPQHLLPKKEMAQIIAELAVAEQTFQYDPKASQEATVRQIFKNHQTTANVFAESYQYYTVKKQTSGIIEQAQKQLLEKHPTAAKSIVERQKNSESKIPLQ